MSVSTLDDLKKKYPEKAKKIEKDRAEEDWENYLEQTIKALNKKYAQTMFGTQHRIVEEVVSEFGFTEYIYYKQAELVLMYQNQKIKTGVNSRGKDITVNKIQAWAEHEDSLTYPGGVVFDPSNSHRDNQLNTWRGYSIQPKQGNWDKIIEHIEDVICAGVDELITYFYNWCAYTVQYPEKTGMAAIVCRGEKGSGKGVMGHFLRTIWGSHGIHISNSQHLVGKFNGHLENTCFLFADEAFFGGDKKNEGILKALITDETLIIERKGVDSKQCKNRLKVFMATNSDFAVMASKDERRYCVCDVSSHRINDKTYFDSLRAAVSNKDVQAAFLHAMLERDISAFSPSKIPESFGLKAQRSENLDSVGKWLLDSFECGYFQTGDKNEDVWDVDQPSGLIFSSYILWCDQQKIDHYGRVSQTKLGLYLSNIGFLKARNEKFRGWHFGDIETAKNKFLTHEKL